MPDALNALALELYPDARHVGSVYEQPGTVYPWQPFDARLRAFCVTGAYYDGHSRKLFLRREWLPSWRRRSLRWWGLWRRRKPGKP